MIFYFPIKIEYKIKIIETSVIKSHYSFVFFITAIALIKSNFIKKLSKQGKINKEDSCKRKVFKNSEENRKLLKNCKNKKPHLLFIASVVFRSRIA
ncbi:hypothetical protein A1D24_11505 [Testudinibacter aquarius]|nr:hypothetical protein A1D24_11505 [Testudinibacter aquarius]